MSRYRVEPCKVSKTFNIYGSGGQVLGYIYKTDDPEILRFKRYIEAHDEIIDVLSDAVFDYGDQAINLIEMGTLLKRLDSEEAQ